MVTDEPEELANAKLPPEAEALETVVAERLETARVQDRTHLSGDGRVGLGDQLRLARVGVGFGVWRHHFAQHAVPVALRGRRRRGGAPTPWRLRSPPLRRRPRRPWSRMGRRRSRR